MNPALPEWDRRDWRMTASRAKSALLGTHAWTLLARVIPWCRRAYCSPWPWSFKRDPRAFPFYVTIYGPSFKEVETVNRQADWRECIADLLARAAA